MSIEHEGEISVPRELERLALPKESYIVMGSGVLGALGIRPVNDIDLVVTPQVLLNLADAGWNKATASTGQSRVEHGVFEAYDSWTEDGVVKTVQELLEDATYIDGIPYNPLHKVIIAKHLRGREKDLVDLRLIEQYLEK